MRCGDTGPRGGHESGRGVRGPRVWPCHWAAAGTNHLPRALPLEGSWKQALLSLRGCPCPQQGPHQSTRLGRGARSFQAGGRPGPGPRALRLCPREHTAATVLGTRGGGGPVPAGDTDSTGGVAAHVRGPCVTSPAPNQRFVQKTGWGREPPFPEPQNCLCRSGAPQPPR